MKGNSTIFVAVAALIGGALLVIQLSKKTTIITQNEEKIQTLESENTTLETAKADLTQKLSTANSTISKQGNTITQAKTQLEDLSTKYDLKVAEYETFVGKAAQELAAKDEKINTLNTELSAAQDKTETTTRRLRISTAKWPPRIRLSRTSAAASSQPKMTATTSSGNATN